MSAVARAAATCGNYVAPARLVRVCNIKQKKSLFFFTTATQSPRAYLQHAVALGSLAYLAICINTFASLGDYVMIPEAESKSSSSSSSGGFTTSMSATMSKRDFARLSQKHLLSLSAAKATTKATHAACPIVS